MDPQKITFEQTETTTTTTVYFRCKGELTCEISTLWEYPIVLRRMRKGFILSIAFKKTNNLDKLIEYGEFVKSMVDMVLSFAALSQVHQEMMATLFRVNSGLLKDMEYVLAPQPKDESEEQP